MKTIAQEIIESFKEKKWLRSSNLSPGCYVADGKSNDSLNDFIYKSLTWDEIYSGKDGEYLFVHKDKSGICFDGKLFEVLDDERAKQLLSCEGHVWQQI